MRGYVNYAAEAADTGDFEARGAGDREGCRGGDGGLRGHDSARFKGTGAGGVVAEGAWRGAAGFACCSRFCRARSADGGGQGGDRTGRGGDDSCGAGGDSGWRDDGAAGPAAYSAGVEGYGGDA